MPRRPTSPGGVPRIASLRVSLTPGEYEEVATAAGDLGAIPWARGVLLRQARRHAAGLSGSVDVAPVVDPAAAELERTERQLEAALLREPRRPDPEVADELGLTVDVVRRFREGRRIGPATTTRRRSGWEARIREAHAAGLTVEGIAERTGYRVATVREYLSRLRLPARRP